MKRWVLAAALGLAWSLALAQSPAATATRLERSRIAAQRQLDLARYAQQEKDCASQFLVNDCLVAVKAKRRQTLAELRRRELELNETERLRLAEQQGELTQQKSESTSPGSSAAQESAAERLQRKSLAKQEAQQQGDLAAQQRAQQQEKKLAKRVTSEAAQAAQAELAAKNARAFQEKKAAAEKHRAELLLRRQTKAPAKPLPDPP